jgi:tetratricopeptide (TPR) repeat protein
MKRIASVLASAALLVSALAAVSVLGSGCNEKPHEKGCEDQALVVDTAVVAYLSKARALHHEANLKEDAGDIEGAIAALRRLTEAAQPHEGTRIPEVEEVLADAHARTAELALRQSRYDAAKAEVDKGLSHATDASYFRGHLLEVGGLIEEARSKSLADAGQTKEAEEARQRALKLLDEAVSVQDRVIGRALSDSGAKP